VIGKLGRLRRICASGLQSCDFCLALFENRKIAVRVQNRSVSCLQVKDSLLERTKAAVAQSWLVDGILGGVEVLQESCNCSALAVIRIYQTSAR
jgi:hypothetical protein